MKGTCVGCTQDAQCSGDTPVCNTASGDCVACLNSNECSGKTPICDTDHFSCVACDGDKGSTAAHPCAAVEAPFCFKSGNNAGKCGVCSTNDDCSGHTANVCNATSGLCAAGCSVDSDCSASDWCNDTTSQCTPKLPNGMHLPSDPGRVATCTGTIGSAVCQTTVCDPADDSCGLAPGDGDCADDEQCRAGTCNSETQKFASAQRTALPRAASCATDAPAPRAARVCASTPSPPGRALGAAALGPGVAIEGRHGQ